MPPLDNGTRLGHFEILGILGAGGMGEVYRARDHKLDRDVAIKVLPRRFAEDKEALLRFEREAKAVAALAHPNILSIYDFGEFEGQPYAVMELLEGQTLREALRDGALPPRKASSLARQIAEGLGAAHDRGIVHRDLKPDNVFITRDGRPRILDFGLAVDREAAARAGDDTVAPTVGKPLTEPGTVLGTAGYMAPEQVRAEHVDHRSDIFSFGCVLYEMLGGRRAFHRKTAVETMTAILREEPEGLDSLSSNITPALERVVRRCLEKNPEERFQSTRDLAFAIDNAFSASGSGPVGALAGDAAAAAAASAVKATRRPGWPLVALAALIGLGAGFVLFRGGETPTAAPEPPRLRTLTVSGRDGQPSASPDGRLVAFVSGRDGTPRIWIKQLKGGGEEPLTEGPDEKPQFSPDGSSLLFIREEGSLLSAYRQSLRGGQVRKVIEDVAEAVWSPDGERAAFIRSAGLADARIYMVGVAGVNGADEVIVYQAPKSMGNLTWSPDGKLITVVQGSITGNSADSELMLIDAVTHDVRLTDPTGDGMLTAAYTWSADGNLVLAIAGSIVGDQGDAASRFVLFNPETGSSRTLFWAQNLFPMQGLRLDAASADIVSSGTLVYHASAVHQKLRIVSLNAPRIEAVYPSLTRSQGRDRQPVYAPDGRSVLFSSNRTGNLDLWRIDLDTREQRQLTDDDAQDWDPVFSRDGSKIAWSSDRSGHLEIWVANVDGSGARQLSNDGVDAENPTFTADDQWVVYWSSNPDKVGIWKVRINGTDAQQLASGAYLQPEVSPDGRYAAYVYLEFDRLRTVLHVLDLETATILPFQITVRAPVSGIDIILGRMRWLPDGTALAFVGVDDNDITGIYAQDFALEGDTSATRRPLAGFSPEYLSESFAISPDGSQMILSTLERISNLMLVDGVEGLEPPK